MRSDGYGTEVLQHRNPLVPFVHVETVHIFPDQHRIPDALLQMTGAQAPPLGGKFGLFVHDRHKIRGKRPGPSPCFRADHKFDRYLSNSCILTQISDVEEEINGLLTYDRKVCKADEQNMRHLAAELKKTVEE